MVGEDVYLDLDYILDSNADVDMNVVGTADGKFVEVQGTGEESTFSYDELQALLTWQETVSHNSLKYKPLFSKTSSE